MKFQIKMLMAIVKLIIGFRIISIGGDLNSVTLILGGIFLMIGGMNPIVTKIFDRIELYLMNKRDPDCGIVRFSKHRSNNATS